MAEANGRLHCERCGEPVEDGRSAVCWGCHAIGLIGDIKRYQRREKYKPDPSVIHEHTGTPVYNATRHPLTGVPILDIPSGPKVCDALEKSKRRPRF